MLRAPSLVDHCDSCLTAAACRVDELIRSEEDPNQKLKLRRFLRGLRSASDDVAQTAQLFAKFDKADPIEYESIVAGNALALNAAFYEYLQVRSVKGMLCSVDAGCHLPVACATCLPPQLLVTRPHITQLRHLACQVTYEPQSSMLSFS